MAVEYHSYLIRVWRDPSGNSEHHGEWCGEVEHIQSGACWKFKSVGLFLDAINAEQHDSAPEEGLQNRGGTGSISTNLIQQSNEERKNV